MPVNNPTPISATQLRMMTLSPVFQRTLVQPEEGWSLAPIPDGLLEIEADPPATTQSAVHFRMPQTAAALLTAARITTPTLIPVMSGVFGAYNLVFSRLSRTRIQGCECSSCSARRGNTIRVLKTKVDYILNNHQIASYQLVIGSATSIDRRRHREWVHGETINKLDLWYNSHPHIAKIRLALRVIDSLVRQLYEDGVEADSMVVEDPMFSDESATMMGVRALPAWALSHPIVAVGPVSIAMRFPELESQQFANCHSSWVHRITSTVTPEGGRYYHPLAIATYRNRAFIIPLDVTERDCQLIHDFGETLVPIQQRLIGMIQHALDGGRQIEATFATMVRDWCQHNSITSPIADVNVRCDGCGMHADAQAMTTYPRVSRTRPTPPTTQEGRLCPGCMEHGEVPCHVCGSGVRGQTFAIRVPGDDSRTIRAICGRCFSENSYRSCQNCGDAFQVQRGARNHSICSRCAAHNIIRRHCDDPDLNPKGEGPRFFGVELEVVAQIDRAAAATAVTKWWNGDAIVKHDGSLPNTGFELVTRPGDLAWHREMWTKFLISERKQSGASNLRSFGESSCGFHIHYSKNAITDIARGKLLAFVNEPTNESILSMLAGRSRNNYCVSKPDIKPGVCNGPAGTSHYSAVNLCNVATDEVRIFKGTLNCKRVLLYLDFVDSLMDFCSQEMVSIKQGKDTNLYRTYVTERKAKWPYLHCYFEYGDAWLRRAIYDIPNMFSLPAHTEVATAE